MPLWNRYESPQIRRLKSDLAAMERLTSESSIVRFKASGSPPSRYLLEFQGKSLSRETGRIGPRPMHRVEIKLGASYPRTMPGIQWVTPIFHPNISEVGMVCLGGYGTHWVPSLHLDALCGMLWDMARYHNYDIRSPYNRDAALWVASQTTFTFPIDPRPLRDLRAALGRIESGTAHQAADVPASPTEMAPVAPSEEFIVLEFADPEPAIGSSAGPRIETALPADDILIISD